MKKVYHGFWWEPSKPDVQWYGKVSWNLRESPRLKLRYKTAEHPAHPPGGNVESLMGRDALGAPITLLRLGCSRSRTPKFLSTNTYHAGHLLRGIHVAELADVRVHRVEFGLQNLGGWIGDEGLTYESIQDGARSEYRRPVDREYPLTRNLSLKVCHHGEGSYKARQHTLGYDIYFTFERKQGVNFDHAFRWINAMTKLMHFASMKEVRPTTIKFHDAMNLGGDLCKHSVEVYNGSLGEALEEDPTPDELVFTFQNVEERFAQFCLDWLRFCAKYDEALGCYSTTVYNNLTDSLRLVSLTQGLEAFHQRRYRPKTKKINFVDRVRELCESQKGRMTELVRDLDVFAKAVSYTRHYYTHHEPNIRRKGEVYSGTRLGLMTFHLQYLFRLCVLAEFNLADDPYGALKRQIPKRFVEYYSKR